MRLLENYSSIIFDCDGVILNSNGLKTEAFYRAAIAYGKPAADALVKYHISNGGVSRYKKFNYFLENIVPASAPGVEGPGIDILLDLYASAVWEGLLSCEVSAGLTEFRQKTPEASWYIVSGGDQSELRKIFAQRKLDFLFDGGIYGSPDTKEQILRSGLQGGLIRSPAVFIGDSRYDYYAAQSVGMEFVFLSGWSEIKDYETWCEENNLASFKNLAEFFEASTSRV